MNLDAIVCVSGLGSKSTKKWKITLKYTILKPKFMNHYELFIILVETKASNIVCKDIR